jgi:hypothetical protein
MTPRKFRSIALRHFIEDVRDYVDYVRAYVDQGTPEATDTGSHRGAP